MTASALFSELRYSEAAKFSVVSPAMGGNTNPVLF
jgi:hypothetical protein